MSRRAFITGASGFIGGHLARALLAQGWVVALLARSEDGAARLERSFPDATALAADVRDFDAIATAVAAARPNIVFHLAADTSVRRFASGWVDVDRANGVNMGGTLNLLRAVDEQGGDVQRVIRAGGLEEYGNGPIPAKEDQREQPCSPYSASQVATTAWCRVLQRKLTPDIVTVRPALVYGPGQSLDFFLPALIDCLARHCPFTIYNGSRARDYLFIDDLIDALIRVTDPLRNLRGEIVNIATGRAHALRDIASIVASLMKRPDLVSFDPDRPSDDGVAIVLGSTDHAKALLDWEARTALPEGLQRTIAWYRHGDQRLAVASS